MCSQAPTRSRSGYLSRNSNSFSRQLCKEGKPRPGCTDLAILTSCKGWLNASSDWLWLVLNQLFIGQYFPCRRVNIGHFSLSDDTSQHRHSHWRPNIVTWTRSCDKPFSTLRPMESTAQTGKYKAAETSARNTWAVAKRSAAKEKQTRHEKF